MSQSRVKRLLKSELETVGVTAVPVGFAALGVELYSSFQNNKLSKTASAIASQIADATTIEEAQRLESAVKTMEHDSFVLSEKQGLIAAGLLAFLTVPSTWSSLRYAPERTAGIVRHYLSNWDYTLGRVLQAAGGAVLAEAFVQHGKQETTLETALFIAAPAVAYVGTLFVKNNKMRHEDAAPLRHLGNSVPGEGNDFPSSVSFQSLSNGSSV